MNEIIQFQAKITRNKLFIYFTFTIKMYIIKLDHSIDDTIFYDKSVTEDIQDLRRNNRQNQLIAKKNFTFSQRFHSTEPDEIQTERKSSDSFRKMMNKVIHRINRRNHFFKDNENNEDMHQNPIHSLKEEPPQVTHSLNYPHRKNKILFQHNKLKIKGIGTPQNESNLLQRQNRQNPFIKTSISFIQNKQFNRNIQQRRLKSFSSDVSQENCSDKGKENSFILNNTRYCPAEFKRTMLEESFKVGSFIPKITAKENYKQMQQLLRINVEAKRNKIDIGKKMFHKKMVERQKNHQIMQTRLRQKSNCQKHKKDSQRTFKSKDKFEPWVTGEDFLQEGFRISRKGHY